MRRRIKYIAIAIIFLLYVYNTVFVKSMIVGKYTAYDEYFSTPVGFNNGAKLELHNNNTFTSPSWGNGTYELTHSLSGTKIDLNIKGGGMGMGTYFYRRFFFSKPRIVINRDLGTDFRKTD